MIYGLFLDPRVWKIDFMETGFWNPDQYGVHIDLHRDAFKIPETGIDPKYKFVIATEVWEKPMQRTLQYLQSKGLKVFLAAREPIKHGDLIDAMFSYERFNIDGNYYFTPDVVLAAGKKYADIWKDKTKTIITGYPRWNYYIDVSKQANRDKFCSKQGLEKDRKIIFFVSYPPYHYKKIDGKDSFIDLFAEHDKTLSILEQFAIKHEPKYQIVSKIHPAAMKCYLKGNDKRKEVAGLLKKYYHAPTKYCKVIGDVRNDGTISKDLLIHSAMVVGYNSTMLLEALLINKPITNIIIGKCKGITTPYDDLLGTVYTEEHLEASLEELDSGFYDNLIQHACDMQIVEDYFYKVDGQCCKRMCEAILAEV
jgi:hypothetical protein